MSLTLHRPTTPCMLLTACCIFNSHSIILPPFPPPSPLSIPPSFLCSSTSLPEQMEIVRLGDPFRQHNLSPHAAPQSRMRGEKKEPEPFPVPAPHMRRASACVRKIKISGATWTEKHDRQRGVIVGEFISSESSCLSTILRGWEELQCGPKRELNLHHYKHVYLYPRAPHFGGWSQCDASSKHCHI